ncbi:MAG: hypothetical protein WC080_03415 [Patescibacteria group bacterium]|jgi:glucuronokinase
MPDKEIIKTSVFARIGFLGNPSDGFGGKTISLPLKNFQAETLVWQSPTFKLLSNSEDQDEYEHVGDMARYVRANGYYGGIRLVKAAIVSLKKYCEQHSIEFPGGNFTISYRSNIPRQSGLAGSSAIIVSTIKSVMKFYKLPEASLPPEILANIAIAAETEELGITAGLQDRVVQSFDAPVYMDFGPAAFKRHGGIFGEYKKINPNLFPEMYIAWNDKPSESGKIHSDVKSRFLDGDQKVVNAMARFAEIAESGMSALLKRDHAKLCDLADQNFDLRRKIYGDSVIGADNLAMIKLARKFGAAAKFPGSGGAIIIIPRNKGQADIILEEFARRKYNIERVVV